VITGPEDWLVVSEWQHGWRWLFWRLLPVTGPLWLLAAMAMFAVFLSFAAYIIAAAGFRYVRGKSALWWM